MKELIKKISNQSKENKSIMKELIKKISNQSKENKKN